VDVSKVNSMKGVLDSASKALHEVLDGAEGRVVATRMRFVGASPVHAEFQGRTQWLRQKLLELAAELHGEGLWIAKVVMATTSKVDSTLRPRRWSSRRRATTTSAPAKTSGRRPG
jgi:hypothetical protein